MLFCPSPACDRSNALCVLSELLDPTYRAAAVNVNDPAQNFRPERLLYVWGGFGSDAHPQGHQGGRFASDGGQQLAV